MDYEKMKKHVNKLCKKNLKDKRVKCCAECPFMEEIIRWFPETREPFFEKKNFVRRRNLLEGKK